MPHIIALLSVNTLIIYEIILVEFGELFHGIIKKQIFMSNIEMLEEDNVIILEM